MPKRLVIVDLDGTLADIRQRLKHAGKEPERRNKKVFQLWLDRVQNEKTLLCDAPLKPVLEMLQGLLRSRTRTKAVYLTGRCEQYRRVTSKWIKAHRLPNLPLFMRKNDDWRSAAAYKQEKIRSLVKKAQPTEVICLDDDGGGDCSAMYLRNGWTHIHIKSPTINLGAKRQ